MICLWSFATPPPPVKDRYIKKKIIAYWKLRAKLRDSCCYLPMTHTHSSSVPNLNKNINLVSFDLTTTIEHPNEKEYQILSILTVTWITSNIIQTFMLFFWISDFIVSICWESKFDTCLNLADDLGPCLHSPTHFIHII